MATKFGFVTCVQLGLACMEAIYEAGGSLDLALTLEDDQAPHKSGRVYLDGFCDAHGVDLVKDTATLEAAYDDDLGVTAAFNRNILRNTNRIAGTDFRPGEWEHVALFNEGESRIEMHLLSTRDQRVRVAGQTFALREGESIHTESSYKYSIEGFHDLARRAGFGPAPLRPHRPYTMRHGVQAAQIHIGILGPVVARTR